MLWGLIFLILGSWAGDPGVRWQRLVPKISLLNLYPPQVGEGPARSVSAPLLPVWMDAVCSFFNSVVVRLSLTLISDGSE